ncbi:MAG: methyltransferase [Thermoplasmatota archaeon]
MFRVALVLLALYPFFFLEPFTEHVQAHFTGAIHGNMITGQWHIVLLNVLAFTAFLIPLAFRRKANWKEFGLVAAFFISLFIEMYGIPLTIMFASKAFGPGPTSDLSYVLVVSFMGVEFAFTLPMLYGFFLMALGTIVVIAGWITLYKGMKKEDLVTSGIYSASRHPQYLGFILVIMGWIIGWTTVLTVIFGTVLIVMYLRVCYKEEDELGKDHDYASYKEKAPFMV